jgi:hypothetical protein
MRFAIGLSLKTLRGVGRELSEGMTDDELQAMTS